MASTLSAATTPMKDSKDSVENQLDIALQKNEMLQNQVSRLSSVTDSLSEGGLRNIDQNVRNAIHVCDDVSVKMQEAMKQMVLIQKCAEMAESIKTELTALLPSLVDLENSVSKLKPNETSLQRLQSNSPGQIRRRRGQVVESKWGVYTAPDPEVLSIFPLFAEFPKFILSKLSNFCYELRRMGGDLILEKGNMSHEIYFVVEVFNCRRTASVVASTDCILIVLTLQKLHEALALHPEYVDKLHKFEDERKDWYSKQNYSNDDDFGGDFLNSIARQNIGNMQCFQCVDDNFIESLSLTVIGELYSEGQYIINAGDDSDCMYFIMNGTIEVVDADQVVHADMGAGSFFGEVGIFFGVKRTASIRAKENVILFKLTKQALMEVAEHYPAFQRRIKEEANERYKCYTDRQEASSNAPVELFDVEVSEKHLMLIGMFESLGPGKVNEVALRMVRKTFLQGKNIVTAGEKADCGKVDIMTEYNEVIETCQGPSCWFGEVGILSDLPRTASIKCKTDCSVYELKDSDMREMMEKYPEVKEGIEETSKERLQAHLMRSILA